MAKTLLLDRTLWDLCLDASGSIALADEPYALAQDAASAVRTFLGECWYNTAIGIPYFTEVLGQLPPVTLLKSLIVTQALTVPGIVDAACYITGFAGRVVTGQLQITDRAGAITTVSF